MKASVPAAAAGMIDVGGDLTVARLGYGAMRITGPGVWGEPPDRDRAERVTPVVSVQNRFNAVDRSSEAMVDLCEQETLIFLPWAPVHYTEASRAVLDAARRHGASAGRWCWPGCWPGRRGCCRSPGSGSPEHVAAAGLELSPDEVTAITKNA